MILDDGFESAPKLALCHLLRPDHNRTALGWDQVDLCVPIAEHMDMSRFMIVGEDDDAQTMRAENGVIIK
jgi:hypothetical protein